MEFETEIYPVCVILVSRCKFTPMEFETQNFVSPVELAKV